MHFSDRKSILDKAQNGIKGNISENWTQKWTAGPLVKGSLNGPVSF